MKLLKLAFALTTVTLLFGCSSQYPQAVSETSSSNISQKKVSTPLKSAIEELRVIKIKIEEQGGINQKEYGENIDELVNIVKNSYGDSKTLSAVKSAVKGHQLALQFWQCDRTTGYDEMYECRDKALKAVFAKYPDIEAQAKAAVAGKQSSFISAGLDKDAMLQAIWTKTSADTDTAIQAINLPSPANKSQP
ncbi:MAG TPA: hypothetical protein V6D48_13230 [Oculatellaceae cyanobacterium]